MYSDQMNQEHTFPEMSCLFACYSSTAQQNYLHECCCMAVFQCELKLSTAVLIYETLLVSKLLTFNNDFTYDITYN
jgi:hypothetical protein